MPGGISLQSGVIRTPKGIALMNEGRGKERGTPEKVKTGAKASFSEHKLSRNSIVHAGLVI
jgi:hypothetical protein